MSVHGRTINRSFQRYVNFLMIEVSDIDVTVDEPELLFIFNISEKCPGGSAHILRGILFSRCVVNEKG